jgi:hypothetical protein
MPYNEKIPFGRFKKHILPIEKLREEAETLKESIESLENYFLNNSIQKKDILSLFVLLFHKSRILNKPFQKNKNILLKLETDISFPREFEFLSENKNIGIYNLLNNFSLKYLPESIRGILLFLHSDKINLNIITKIPSSFEMLEIQTKGGRYITIDFLAAKSGNLIEKKRDSFEFVLHDLEHAYCFFHPSFDTVLQIEFYKKIFHNYHMYEEMIKEDELFKRDLEYCISDMNSHPEHLISYLRATLINYFLRKGNKKDNERLTLGERNQIDILLGKF